MRACVHGVPVPENQRGLLGWLQQCVNSGTGTGAGTGTKIQGVLGW